MEKKTKQLHLLDDFPEPTYEQWLNLVENQSKDVLLGEKLVNETIEGIRIQPIYTHTNVGEHVENMPGFYPFVRGTTASGYKSNGWGIGMQFFYPDPAAFNEAVRNDILRGLNMISIVLDRAGKSGCDPQKSGEGQVGKDGLSITSLQDLTEALDGVEFSALSFQIDAGIAVFPFTSLMLAILESRHIPFCDWKGSLNFDPLETLAVTGGLNRQIEHLYDEMACLTKWATQHAPKLQTIGVHAYPYRESGANAVQELAISMATGVEYLRKMHERGLGVDEVAPNIRFSFLTGSDFYTEIAKLRAARILWAQIVGAFNGNETSQKMTMHVGSSHWNKTRHDPYLNIVRATIESFSSLIGNCDSLTVAPFDEIFGLPNETSCRIARNTQIILKEECHADKVIDPAGGSWFVEYLTDQLGHKAWTLFQEIEKAGGIMGALKKGLIWEEIDKIVEKRKTDTGRQKNIVVGTNAYVNEDEENLSFEVPDYEAIRKKRIEVVENFLGERDNEMVARTLQKVSSSFKARSNDLLETAVTAALNGATLGEIISSIGTANEEILTVRPLCIRRHTEDYEELHRQAYK